jgi:competence protein ComFC
MINISPRKIYGNWFEGYALDVHTISSEFLGYDEFGHQVFDTKRSEMGELLYKLKYKQDKKVIPDIVEVTVNFINNNWKDIINGIIPVPPSRTQRKLQPVIEIARGIGNSLGIPLYDNILLKSKEKSELKNVFDFHDRLEILRDNFIIDNKIVRGKQILLFDDLFRSGATLTAATDVLYKQGNVEKVYVLTLTRTRKLS